MSRTKLFVSYSHRDREWLDRLRVHLAILERRGLVHVWSDTRIGGGARWQDEIESALTEAEVAILLISPEFLASDFIWRDEMPRILAHQKDGMAIFPLIVRPCAWRIATELAELQARPVDGRALSLGTEAELDRDMAEFVYELSARIGQLPAGMASEEVESVRRQHRTMLPRMPYGTSQMEPPVEPVRRTADVSAGAVLGIGQLWTGIYLGSNRRLQLTIRELDEREFRAGLVYVDDGSATDVEGRILADRELSEDRTLKTLRSRVPDAVEAVSFRETRVAKKGQRPVDLNGEYRAIVGARRMLGVWMSDGRVLGEFELEQEEPASD
jgi:hypothetical protein